VYDERMARQRSAFDIVGPVMIGPSSSHTAGAVRLGALARAVFGHAPQHARIVLHGSFSSTGRGHGTDLALVAGLLGLSPDDPRIPEAFELAAATGLAVAFEHADLGEVHPNTAEIHLSANGTDPVCVVGSSLGGGSVLVSEIDGFEVEATGDMPLLLVNHTDQPGEIAQVTGLIARSGVNIAAMRVSRVRRGCLALMLIETDAEVPASVAEEIAALPAVSGVRRVPAV